MAELVANFPISSLCQRSRSYQASLFCQTCLVWLLGSFAGPSDGNQAGWEVGPAATIRNNWTPRTLLGCPRMIGRKCALRNYKAERNWGLGSRQLTRPFLPPGPGKQGGGLDDASLGSQRWVSERDKVSTCFPWFSGCRPGTSSVLVKFVWQMRDALVIGNCWMQKSYSDCLTTAKVAWTPARQSGQEP